MTSFTALLKNDIRLFLRDWKACILLLIVPVFFISFFTYALSPYLEESSFIEPFPIAVVDREDSTLTRMLVNQVEEIDIFSEVLVMDEDGAMQSLVDKEVGGVIIIPEDFINSVSMGENKPVTVIGNGAMPLQAYIVKNTVQSAANYVTAVQGAINTIWHYDTEAGLSYEEKRMPGSTRPPWTTYWLRWRGHPYSYPRKGRTSTASLLQNISPPPS